MTKTFRETAVEAWDNLAPQREKADARRASCERTNFAALLKERGIEVDAESIDPGDFSHCAFIVLDGLRFEYRTSNYGYSKFVALVRKCDKCSEEVVENISSLSDLGRIIKAATLGPRHESGDCTKGQPPQSIGERLEEVIREIAREEVPA